MTQITLSELPQALQTLINHSNVYAFWGEPVEHAISYGRDVIPLVRQQVEREERQTATAA
ncbi:hypothetical protein [Dolichospermum flos-aquae]|jgi:hypothetical protein|uniref:hypothetical protein n=1 Tax=Dolichospermum flosaquae TaxID=1166 RepID=UPI001B3736E4|nr:hypothetical protein [Dolichospermum flos-aquae]